MLSNVELIVIEYLKKNDCESNYKIIEFDEILNFLRLKDSTITKFQLKSIINNLSNEKYITVKYCDESVVCLNLLKNKEQEVQTKTVQKNKKEQNNFLFFALICFLCSFFGCLVANLIVLLIW